VECHACSHTSTFELFIYFWFLLLARTRGIPLVLHLSKGLDHHQVLFASLAGLKMHASARFRNWRDAAYHNHMFLYGDGAESGHILLQCVCVNILHVCILPNASGTTSE
jgi:hypothetical protein